LRAGLLPPGSWRTGCPRSSRARRDHLPYRLRSGRATPAIPTCWPPSAPYARPGSGLARRAGGFNIIRSVSPALPASSPRRPPASTCADDRLVVMKAMRVVVLRVENRRGGTCSRPRGGPGQPTRALDRPAVPIPGGGGHRLLVRPHAVPAPHRGLLGGLRVWLSYLAGGIGTAPRPCPPGTRAGRFRAMRAWWPASCLPVAFRTPSRSASGSPPLGGAGRRWPYSLRGASAAQFVPLHVPWCRHPSLPARRRSSRSTACSGCTKRGPGRPVPTAGPPAHRRPATSPDRAGLAGHRWRKRAWCSSLHRGSCWPTGSLWVRPHAPTPSRPAVRCGPPCGA